jgi:nucleoside-diphosphate-sugar epimerase/quercetin dioxygenase-like cupin family protein/SAM-dependent methyltransferase
MKKIVITGGLGYLGTELCRLYSGVSRVKKIIAIDKRFLSERVSELKNWNIEFIQGSILDKKFIENIVKDADVIHHLAGITDVAYIKDDINPQRDKNIEEVAIIGTNNIIDSIKKSCKIIFPSTHVVFEGLNEVRTNLSEDEKVFPVLSYAKSKVQNEIDIQKKVNNYIILRLASVYGFSSDSTRLGIMPNLFSKMSSQNNEISLYAEGKQLKSLVSIIDVVRCMKFMEESTYNNQIFHLSNENCSVKDVALLCKKINTRTKILETKEKIPNLGYTLSNKKLLSTGFKFLYNLEESIKEMIFKWSFTQDDKTIEYIKRGEKEFVDERGKISNYELTEPINLIGYIESKKGTVRANHFHPVQEQKCLVLKGQFISVIKDLLENTAIVETKLVNAGDLVVTKPNVAHAMVFTQDTVFLNLVRGEREHDNYGITHTIPHMLVNQNETNKLLTGYKYECRCCYGKKLERIFSFGYLPLANNLLDREKENFEQYPLELNYCPNCFNCQLSYVVDPNKLFKNYLYLSSVSNSFQNHFIEAANEYIKEFGLTPEKSFVLDIGSNDGVALIPFKEKNFNNLLGIEPAKNLSEISIKKGIPTLNTFFNKEILKNIKNNFDLILLSNVFAHSDQIEEIIETAVKLLNKKGVIIIEVQYLLNTIKDLTFDNIYHEHVNYWSLTSLKFFLNKFNLEIFKALKINTHGGSLRIYVAQSNVFSVEKNVEEILDEEIIFGIKNVEIFKEFSRKISIVKNNVKKNFNLLKEKYKQIYGYGAPAKASTLLNFFNISEGIVNIIEDNHLKVSKYIPGTSVEIINKDDCKELNIDCLIVFAWNFFEEIKKNNSGLSKKIISIKDLEKDNFVI